MVRINREALLQIVAGLFAMIGDAAVSVLSRHERLAILSELRPAEAAVRRLVAILADGLDVGARGGAVIPTGAIAGGEEVRVPAFRLLDPRRAVGTVVRRVPGHGPNVRGFDGDEYFAPIPPVPQADDSVDAGRVWRRLLAVQGALDDLPRQARRLVRALAKRMKPMRAMRPGRPPGHVARGRRPVDIVLADCHVLALMKLAPP